MKDTRQRLVDAATRVFAEDGVAKASLLEIARRSGQRNRGAVHYHFGSRAGLLAAVLDQYADELGEREGQLLRQAVEAGRDELAPVVEAIVRPVVEISEKGWRGRCYLRIVAEVVETDPATLDPDVRAVLERTGGYPVYDELTRLLPDLDGRLRDERLTLFTAFVLRSVADRARNAERTLNGRHRLATEPFIANLVAMAAAMLAAPVDGDMT